MDLLLLEPKAAFGLDPQLDNSLFPDTKGNMGDTLGFPLPEPQLLQPSALIGQLPIPAFSPSWLLSDYTEKASDLTSGNTDIITGSQADSSPNTPLSSDHIIIPIDKKVLAGNSQDIGLFEKNYTPDADVRTLTTSNSLAAATSSNAMLLGIYYGNQGWNMPQVQALESWQGKKHAVVNLFTDWKNNSQTIGNLFNQQLGNIWNNKNVPLVTWEPFTGTATPLDIEVRIANGEYDAYINTWADKMKTFLSGADTVYGTADDRRAYLRLAHEMNGNWYPWSAAVGNNSPTDYINMWQHVKGIFDGKGMEATRLQWVWSVNHSDVGGFSAEQFYPGDAYVDWIAVDGYNWGTSQNWSSWNTPQQIYGGMIDRLRILTDNPLAITEFASTTAGGGVTGKSQWITDAFNYFAGQNVKMAVWFNQDKETDWAMFGGANGDSTYKSFSTTYKTYKSYKNAIASGNIIPSTPTNPRLLTDAQFSGLI
ncbi:glycoside hydrolase family 26 protein [Microseira wollei]|uniref:Endoglucanase H n=1 Tax=Microseira wollei NIES-4236 TaxID=2530354 RepID=A0AAV3XLQ3_9CYAN|nr:glycosyl hydrolase [Microseira wollei]GET41392.1 endoglucanase H [Microseira wollei NIES-4236]